MSWYIILRKRDSFRRAYDQFDPRKIALDKSKKIEELKQFKVTSYTIKRFLPAKDKSQVLIIAEIKYFRITNLVVKSVSDRQLWKYDIAEKRWYLTSGLPDFN